jgi:hypothetical protein
MLISPDLLKSIGEDIMSKPASIRRLFGLIFVAALATVLFGTRNALADSLVSVTSLGALGETDSVTWSQLGGDATALSATLNATSTGAIAVTGTLSAAGSLTSVVCPETPCSWGTPGSGGFNAGDTLVWTSDTANGGTGPLKLTLGQSVKGVGALIQADGPAQFTAQIQAFNGTASLGSFTESSDSTGDAVFLGVLDNTASNITAVTYSLTACTGACTDFAIDTVYINNAPTTATLTVTPPSVAFGNVDATGMSRARRVSVVNRGTVTANIGTATVPSGFTIVPGLDTCSNTALAARRSCSVQVEFSPPTVMPFSGPLTIPYNGAMPLTVSLTGTGTAVTVLPRSPRFAPVAAGMTSPRPVTAFITNESRVATIALGGASHSGPFLIAPGTDTCANQSLGPRHRCTVGLEFAPPQGTASKTPESGTLAYLYTYGSNNGSVTVQLNATVK